ncbi:MAG: sugar ABC transporter permease [Clostridia bacterium]|nr:sugar ABC transporter permease [Clostridia bacterium]
MSQAAIKRRKPAVRNRDMLWQVLYLLPALIFFLVFKYWPIIYNVILSFAKWNFVKEIQWIGFKNYATMFSKVMFVTGLKNTLWYILALFPFFVVIPLILAALIAEVKSRWAMSFYQAVSFIPTMLAFSIICIVWLWIFNPSQGVLNKLLRAAGFSDGYSWLSDPRTAFFSITLVCGWKYIGTHMILFMAGLKNVDMEVQEAAEVDGANAWQVFWRIKFPLLKHTTVYIVITSVIFAAERAFIAINLLTQGGPSYTTTNLSYVIYEFAFKSYNIGIASAIATFTAAIFLVLSVVMMRTTGGAKAE